MDVKRHVFWQSGIGSQYNFYMVVPPESQLKCLRVTCVAMQPRKRYKIEFVLFNGERSVVYCSKKEALNVIQKDWMYYYRERTRTEFIEHREVDLSTLVSERLSKTNKERRLSLPSSLSTSSVPSGQFGAEGIDGDRVEMGSLSSSSTFQMSEDDLDTSILGSPQSLDFSPISSPRFSSSPRSTDDENGATATLVTPSEGVLPRSSWKNFFKTSSPLAAQESDSSPPLTHTTSADNSPRTKRRLALRISLRSTRTSPRSPTNGQSPKGVHSPKTVHSPKEGAIESPRISALRRQGL